MVLDVLKEDPFGFDLSDDAGDMRKEVPRVFFSEEGSGLTEGLAGIPGSEEMNSATPSSAVEGLEVTPDRSLLKAPVCHARKKDFDRAGFPFNVTDDSRLRNRESDTEIESSDPGAT